MHKLGSCISTWASCGAWRTRVSRTSRTWGFRHQARGSVRVEGMQRCGGACGCRAAENGVGIINVSCIFVTCVRRPGSQDERATANWGCGEDCEVIGCVVSTLLRGSVRLAVSIRWDSRDWEGYFRETTSCQTCGSIPNVGEAGFVIIGA
jgi:hypothetical protein